MAFLQNSNIHYYFPFTSGTQGMAEDTKGVTWSDGGAWIKQGTSGLIGSGVYSVATANNRCESTGTRSPNYSGSTGTTSLTFAVWSSGVSGYSQFAAGWEHVSNGNAHAFRLSNDSTSHMSMSYWFNDALSSPLAFNGGANPVVSGNGWTLIVARIEINGADISGCLSVNGGAWQNMGTRAFGASTWESIADGKTFIGWANRYGPETNHRPLDEFTVWRNNTKFTSGELQNLYDLGKTYSRPMTEYSQQYAGWTKASGNVTAFTSGIGLSSGSIPLHTIQKLVVSGSTSGFMTGLGWASQSGNLYIAKQAWASGTASGYLHSQYALASGSLYIRGMFAHQRDLFLKTWAQGASTDVNAMIFGSSGLKITFGQANLSLFNDSDSASRSATYPLFLRALDVEVEPITASGQRTLLLRGGNVVHGTVSLCLHNETASGCIDLVVKGLGDADTSDGYVPTSALHPLFLKTVPGAVGELPLFVDGQTYPSGFCDAWVFGVSGMTSLGRNAFLHGREPCGEYLPLFCGAIWGGRSGYMGLYVSGVCSPVGDNIPLYGHGF